ncbi:MAG: hypothetical protein ABIT58_02955 [Ferruginibacter sp.]
MIKKSGFTNSYNKKISPKNEKNSAPMIRVRDLEESEFKSTPTMSEGSISGFKKKYKFPPSEYWDKIPAVAIIPKIRKIFFLKNNCIKRN